MSDQPAEFAHAMINVAQPTTLTIQAPAGSTLLTIHADGRWEFRDDAAPTEAARVFVHEARRLITPPGDTRT